MLHRCPIVRYFFNEQVCFFWQHQWIINVTRVFSTGVCLRCFGNSRRSIKIFFPISSFSGCENEEKEVVIDFRWVSKVIFAKVCKALRRCCPLLMCTLRSMAETFNLTLSIHIVDFLVISQSSRSVRRNNFGSANRAWWNFQSEECEVQKNLIACFAIERTYFQSTKLISN